MLRLRPASSIAFGIVALGIVLILRGEVAAGAGTLLLLCVAAFIWNRLSP
jgi:hypothetical protein